MACPASRAARSGPGDATERAPDAALRDRQGVANDPGLRHLALTAARDVEAQAAVAVDRPVPALVTSDGGNGRRPVGGKRQGAARNGLTGSPVIAVLPAEAGARAAGELDAMAAHRCRDPRTSRLLARGIRG